MVPDVRKQDLEARPEAVSRQVVAAVVRALVRAATARKMEQEKHPMIRLAQAEAVLAELAL